MGLFRRRGRIPPSNTIKGIEKNVLDTIFDASRKMHPLEFAGALTASGDHIDGLLMIPGAISGERHAIFNTYNLPADMSRVGSVHSHPSPNPFPSDADLQLFRTFGRVHIIVASPYGLHSWRAYDSSGENMHLVIVEKKHAGTAYHP